LSSIPINNVVYSDNDWNDITSKYNLYKEIEIVIRQDDTTSTASTTKSNKSPWIIRTLIATSTMALLGNFPVQSHLLSKNPVNDLLTFEINSHNSILTKKNHLLDTSSSQIIVSSEAFTIDESSAPHELTLPIHAIETYAGHVTKDQNSKWKTYHVKSYDNLTNIFHKIGHQSTLKTLKANKEIFTQLKDLKKKGTVVRARSTDGKLSELVLSRNTNKSFVISLNKNNKYISTWKKQVFEIRQSRSSFTIKNGLFFDGKKSGIGGNIMKQFVKVFDWDIDFSHDVRVGDKVTVVFEEIFHDGDKVGSQHLLAAEFINKGREFRTIRYVNKEGKADYFTPQGRQMKRAFIRTPIAHARISSHFNPGRFHPKLHKIRAHKGTDFAARTGTPIMATGNGTIVSVGRKGGYGRTIIIRHREGYTTTYAHMSRYKKGIRAGKKVYQGDIIGYVGQSGLATGPHLHYEFRKNGKAVNAMTVSLPNSMSLSRTELQDFRNKAINLVLQLNVLHRFVEADIEIDSSIGG